MKTIATLFTLQCPPIRNLWIFAKYEFFMYQNLNQINQFICGQKYQFVFPITFRLFPHTNCRYREKMCLQHKNLCWQWYERENILQNACKLFLIFRIFQLVCVLLLSSRLKCYWFLSSIKLHKHWCWFLWNMCATLNYDY